MRVVRYAYTCTIKRHTPWDTHTHSLPHVLPPDTTEDVTLPKNRAQKTAKNKKGCATLHILNVRITITYLRSFRLRECPVQGRSATL